MKKCKVMLSVMILVCLSVYGADKKDNDKIQISGIYPHLAAFSTNGEVGIGAAVPWAGKLWTMTYPPHHPEGGSDKLYEIDSDLNMTIRPESVGGTHAGRMIHKESNQLVMGPYFIDASGKVRVADIHKLRGRLTAVARHLTDPANKVYIYDMEGAVYEVDVHSLDPKKLFDRPVPGWHGKGGYTGQGRLVIANNGESPADKKKYTYLVGDEAKEPEEAGILAEWDGKDWKIIERRQFTDVTGPGGIYGSPDDKSPLWSIGWDKRSVILKLLDGGTWSTFRLPKASHCYDPKHGWYTEWPRIREAAAGKLMMDMHGMFYNFPSGFCSAQTGGINPIASHLRYIPDFCDWNGKLVLASDDTSIMQNPMAGKSQSNLWFGHFDDLPTFGPRSGWGGPWVGDKVKAGQISDPFLVKGFLNRVVHIANDGSEGEVVFTFEVDKTGDSKWAECCQISVPAHGYRFYLFPKDLDASWIRVKADKECKATVYFHYSSPRDTSKDAEPIFESLATINDSSVGCAGIVRPSKINSNLEFVVSNKGGDVSGYEVNEKMEIISGGESVVAAVKEVAKIKKELEIDEASGIMTLKDKRYRIPISDPKFGQPSEFGLSRCVRECVSERYLFNACGTFYEMPRDSGLPWIKPVTTHNRQIMDFCTWRGLMVLSGTKANAKPDGHYFCSANGKAGLWFGSIDDLWRLGKPVGKGGPWKNADVQANKPSDPYLMTGYDRKKVEITSDKDANITLEVDFDHQSGWHKYLTFKVKPGKTAKHEFSEGFSAHWVRAVSDTDCKATVWFVYE